MARALDWEPGDLSLRVSPSTALSGQVTSSLGVTFSIPYLNKGYGLKELS